MSGHYHGYPDCAESGVSWIGKAPTHWAPIKFKRVLSEKKHTSNPALPAGSISFGRVVYKDSETLAKTTKASYQEVLPGEFLVNPLNLNFDLKSLRTGLSDIAVVVSTGYIVLHSDSRLDKRFTRWLLQQFDVAHMKSLGAGVRQTINYTDIGNSTFLSPPLEEQTQIAKFLDYETAKIDALIEKQQQLIALLKEKRQAVISHAVTKGLNPEAPMRDSGVEWLGEVPAHWDVSRLKYVAHVIDCRNKTPEYFDDGKYFVIRTTNVKEQQLLLDEATLRTDQRNFDIWTQRGIPPAGSILFTREAPAGEVCLVPAEAKLCMGQRMMNFIPFDDAQVGYLFSYLLSNCLTRYIGSVSLGSTVSHLRVDQVENIPVPVPPNEEARMIADYVNAMRENMKKLITVAGRKIGLLQERRTAVISAAVTGKIDVRGWKAPEYEAEAVIS